MSDRLRSGEDDDTFLHAGISSAIKNVAIDACQVFACNALLAFNVRAGIAVFARMIKVVSKYGYIILFFGERYLIYD
jgi:hypothetical protein